jgi:hypothetical protein
MALNTSRNMQIHVDSDVVTISAGGLRLTVPARQVGELARAFGAAWVLVGGDGGADPAGVLTGGMVTTPASTRGGLGAPATVAPSMQAPAKQPLGSTSGVTATKGRRAATSNAAGPTAPAAPASEPTRGKRRSRKRVGVALAAWLGKNPGWYTEAELLDIVVRERMSDADPHRALKIALGKQRDIFSQDPKGRWGLGDGLAAMKTPAPSAKPAVTATASSAQSAAAEEPPKKRGPGRPKGSGRKAVALADLGAQAAPKRGPGRPKGSGLKRPQAAEPTSPPLPESRPIRVKRGQTRDEVLQRGRKSTAPELDVDRIRRNLFSEPAS